MPPQSSESRRVSIDNISQLVFRIGFASIFLVNSIYAMVKPGDFLQLLYLNPVTNTIGFTEIMIKIAMVNDMLLAICILIGWRKKLVYFWAGAWLLMIASIKLMNLFID